MIQIKCIYIVLMENIIILYLNWRVFFYKLSSKIASNFTKQKLWYDVKLFGCMFKCTNIFIYVCNIIDTCRCTCIFVLNLVYMKYMQQRSSPVRLYVNMKYCRVLDSQKQWLLFACLLNLLNSCRHFLECLTAQCPRSRDNWYDIDQAVWRGSVDSCLGFIHMQYTVNI